MRRESEPEGVKTSSVEENWARLQVKVMEALMETPQRGRHEQARKHAQRLTGGAAKSSRLVYFFPHQVWSKVPNRMEAEQPRRVWGITLEKGQILLTGGSWPETEAPGQLWPQTEVWVTDALAVFVSIRWELSALDEEASLSPFHRGGIQVSRMLSDWVCPSSS